MIALTRDHTMLIACRLELSRSHQPTYPETGRTEGAELPHGYNHDRLSLPVGRGAGAWDRARQAIRLWRAHAHAGIAVTPADAPIQPGATVIVSRTFGPLVILAPCRIICVADEPDRFGFAYGTLPGHPERGEEAFHVRRHDDGSVTAEVVAFSRPAEPLVRAASPVARKVQQAALHRYLEGIGAYVAATP